MKAITIRQPWASLVALGIKRIETRSWSTQYRGRLAIHAGARQFGLNSPIADLIRDGFPRETYRRLGNELCMHAHGTRRHAHHVDCEMCDNYPLGAIVATCELVDVIATYPHMTVEWPDQMPYGDFTSGRFAWVLDDIRQVTEPIPQRGYQGLWNWDNTNAQAA